LVRKAESRVLTESHPVVYGPETGAQEMKNTVASTMKSDWINVTLPLQHGSGNVLPTLEARPASAPVTKRSVHKLRVPQELSADNINVIEIREGERLMARSVYPKV